MAPDDLWPSWKVINVYTFGKPTSHTITVPSFKCLWSKCQSFGAFFPALIVPYDLWASWKLIRLSIFGKPSLHSTTVARFKFLCSLLSEKNATLIFFGALFGNNYDPWWPLTFARGHQSMHFWKALITYYHHTKFQDSMINSLCEKINVNVLYLHADANADTDADAGRMPTQCIST